MKIKKNEFKMINKIEDLFSGGSTGLNIDKKAIQ